MAERAPPIPAPVPAPAKTAATGGPNAVQVAERIGLLDDGAFVLPIGPGLRLGPELLGKAKVEIDRKYLPPLPGLRLDKVGFDPRSRSAMISIKGKTAIPLTEARDFTLNFGRDGKPAAASINTKATLDWIGRPDLRMSWTPDTGLAASITVAAKKFLPASMAKVATASGDVSLSLDQGKLSGALDTVITVRDVLKAEIKGGFGPDGLAAKVALDSQSKWLGEVKGTGEINAAGVMSARIEKQATELPTPVKGLSFKGGMLSVALNPDRTISGGFTGLTLDYAGLATATASFLIEGGKFSGKAELDLTIPGMTAAKGQIAMKDGKLSGAFALDKDAFPDGLPLKSGKISGSVSETGALAFSGSVEVALGPAGTGKLMASYTDAGFSIGCEVDLAVPGLQTAAFKIAYNGTDLAGEGELAIDPALLSGIQGRMKIKYAEGLWAGETTLGYTADDGKLAGTITVRARQAEDKSIKISGDGEVTAKIAPRLEGKLQATILEEGGIDVSGSITVTDPIEMFPEKRFEKELINKSTNIPLWAILVAVLRFRAGVRAGIGPGVFRNITVTGSYSIGKEGEPSFSISGEMYIPAFVEGYVGFGAGLGLDVLLGSLTGGIEAMGTAGIYGAISVIPELEYKDGDYAISGVATMAAGARLKISLNAWAEIEALWITVWDNTWELASFTMPVGPDLGLSATMAYTFGKPEAPTLEFNTSDVDTDKLISDAMPKDGPPSAGVKQDTKNAAKWQGAQKAKGPVADAVPPEAKKEVPPVAAPPGKGKKSGKPAKGEKIDPKAADTATKDAALPDPTASGTVPKDKVADTKEPRHGTLSLVTLAEPPVALPRSKAQQVADVDAAAQMVQIISEQAETTDELDNQFPAIKKRFALGSIGYEVQADNTVVVNVEVNATRKVAIKDPIKNVDGQRKETKIAFTHGSRDFGTGADAVSDVVGVRMVADPLTPDHEQGAGPSSAALGKVFQKLETMGETGDHGYIKGHLLNDNLGGLGISENLYPITQRANAQHNAQIEEIAKDYVNVKHYWVRYEVNIEKLGNDRVEPGTTATKPKVIVTESEITSRLCLIRADGSPGPVIKQAKVVSRFNRDRSFVEGSLTKAELENVAQKGQNQKARDHAQDVLDGRETQGTTFAALPKNQPVSSGDAALQQALSEETHADIKKTAVPAGSILLSKASAGRASLELAKNVLVILGRLAGVAGRGTRLPDVPAQPFQTLGQRIGASGASGLGPVYGTILATEADQILSAQLQAEAQQDPKDKKAGLAVDVSSMLGTDQYQAMVAFNRFGQITSAATEIRAAIAEYESEAKAVAVVASKGRGMGVDDWVKLGAAFPDNPTKRVNGRALAQHVVEQIGYSKSGQYGLNAGLLADFETAGGLSGPNSFFAAMRTLLGLRKS